MVVWWWLTRYMNDKKGNGGGEGDNNNVFFLHVIIILFAYTFGTGMQSKKMLVGIYGCVDDGGGVFLVNFSCLRTSLFLYRSS